MTVVDKKRASHINNPLKMEISEEFFNQLNPSYQNIIKELEKRLKEYELDEEKQAEISLEVAENYLLPKEYWVEIIRHFLLDDNLRPKMAWKAYDQFYYDIEMPSLMDHNDKCDFLFNNLEFVFRTLLEDIVEYTCTYEPNEDHLLFPHSHLTQCFNLIESKSNKPLPENLVEKYKANKLLYEKIKYAENDAEKWIKLLCKAAIENDDDEYIVKDNVEYRLGSNLMDKKLWKLYIEYLREHDPKGMLQVYSKYCRFFLDDSEMKEKYKKEAKTYGPVYVKWKNLFDFESPKDDKSDSENGESENESEESSDVDSEKSEIEGPYSPKRMRLSSTGDNDISDKDVGIGQSSGYVDKKNESPGDKNHNIQHPELANLCKNFYSVCKLQDLPFKNPFMTYILDNVNSRVLKYLHQSCKYFYARKPIPVIHRLVKVYPDETSICQESLLIGCGDEYLSFIKNAFVSTTFDARNVYASSISEIISKLYRCDANYIFIQCRLSFSDLKFLIESGCVVVFKWTRDMDGTERRNGSFTKRYDAEFNKPSLLHEDEVKDPKFNEPPLLPKDEIYCNLEEIVQYMPYIEELEIWPIRVTSTTFTTLLNRTFLSKIYSLKLYGIQGEAFDADEFLEFCIKNRARRFILGIGFHESLRGPFATEVKEKIKIYQKSTKETVLCE